MNLSANLPIRMPRTVASSVVVVVVGLLDRR